MPDDGDFILNNCRFKNIKFRTYYQMTTENEG
jgi:hypothetical protein